MTRHVNAVAREAAMPARRTFRAVVRDDVALHNSISVHVTPDLLLRLQQVFANHGKRVAFSVQSRHDGMYHVWGTRPVMASVLAVLLQETVSEEDVRVDVPRVLGQ